MNSVFYPRTVLYFRRFSLPEYVLLKYREFKARPGNTFMLMHTICPSYVKLSLHRCWKPQIFLEE